MVSFLEAQLNIFSVLLGLVSTQVTKLSEQFLLLEQECEFDSLQVRKKILILCFYMIVALRIHGSFIIGIIVGSFLFKLK